ncbi:hydrogenase maturation protease [Prauserella shujinwangii]|uniref:Hydrogenase maturation protease n=1 Tax=Prauserella shujinwangii TaxID=1453103 RepID=A0A2T0LSC4_9PSEU|nr:hydrogenase maturation protease [Prauserella shujinwangii]PRX46515.1 hydrogenase maturation protease [Prauserella shujinwangii]
MRPRVLVAGLGNGLLGDDGFGTEVVRRLADEVLPSWVQIADFGLRGGHLTCDLLGGYDTTVLIDATPHGGPPGGLYVLGAELDEEDPSALPALLDSHGFRPEAALRLLQVLGVDAGQVYLVGCEPVRGAGVGLSAPVAAAVGDAVRIVTDLVWGTEPARLAGSVHRFEVKAPRQLETVRGE